MAQKSRRGRYVRPTQAVKCATCGWRGQRVLKVEIQYGPCPTCGGVLARYDAKEVRRFEKAQADLVELGIKGSKL